MAKAGKDGKGRGKGRKKKRRRRERATFLEQESAWTCIRRSMCV
jgi:hypothetical protein